MSMIMRVFSGLDSAGAWVGLLSLRVLLAYEFWESGVEKWRGQNWFADIQAQLPFPVSLLPVEWSWQMATWAELLTPIALVLGFATRFASVSLMFLTVVAWASVHAGLGYNVCDNGFKLPLMYLAMLLPLVLMGAGKLSLDALIARQYGRQV